MHLPLAVLRMAMELDFPELLNHDGQLGLGLSFPPDPIKIPTPFAGFQPSVDLAERLPAAIVTNDLALSRIASIHGVAVLNMNEVANALKPNILPGDRIELRLILGHQDIPDARLLRAFPFVAQLFRIILTHDYPLLAAPAAISSVISGSIRCLEPA